MDIQPSGDSSEDQNKIPPFSLLIALGAVIAFAAFSFITSPWDQQASVGAASQATAASGGLMNALAQINERAPEQNQGVAGTVVGELIHIISEFVNEDGTGFNGEEHEYYIKDNGSGKYRKVLTNGEELPGGASTGDIVKIDGLISDNFVEPNTTDGSDAAAVEVVSTAENLPPLDERSVLVLPGNFTDRNYTCAAQVGNQFFGNDGVSVRDRYLEVSNGVTTFTGEVAPTVTIPYPSSDTNRSAWGSALLAAAEDAGYNTAAYDHIVYALPPNGTGAGGTGYINGRYSWVYYCDVGNYMHEFGHNLGLAHASTQGNAYGDQTSLMGNSWVSHKEFNAPNKHKKGWVPDSQIVSAGSGTYTISPLDYHPSNVNAAQMLRIPRDGTGDYFYISYRDGEGSSASLPPEYDDKVHVHTWRGNPDNSDYYVTYWLSTLAVGQTYTDSVSGFTVTYDENVAGNAVVTLSTNCSSNAPSISVSPTSVTSPGSVEKSYNVTVRNNDSAMCAAKSFDVSGVVPSGWTLKDNFGAPAIAAGGSYTGQMLVTPVSDVVLGTYNLSFTVPGASVGATYVVDNTPPNAPTGLTAQKKGKRVQLTWNAPVGGNAVDHYRVYRNGAFADNAGGTNYNDSFYDQNGLNTYTVTAVDSAGNESVASNEATYDASSSDGGGGDTGGSGKPDKCTPWPECRNN